MTGTDLRLAWGCNAGLPERRFGLLHMLGPMAPEVTTALGTVEYSACVP